MPLQKFGRYEIEQELGRGGMAVVYLARDPYMKRQVAVKVLPHQFTSDPQFRARFQREAEVIAALEHPHIVPIHDYGEQDEQLFLVMRYMPGGSLADCLRRGPLSTAEIARIVTPLASALDKAHARGIIHRDLKPGNILFDAEGEPYISDFGIAKLTQASTLLSGSALVGTPVYMSPEQWRGEKVDGRSDIYALGGMVFEMLSGRLPYEASTPAEVMFKCLMEPPPRLLDTISDLSPMLETIVARAMAKDRDERFATAGELAIALQAAIQNVSQGVGLSPAPIEAAVPARPEAAPEAVETEVEELPPVTPPTVAATPPPTMPAAVAREAIEGDGGRATEDERVQAEAPAAITAPVEAAEAAPLEAPEPAAEIAPMTRTPTVTPPARPATQRAPRPLARFALPVAAIAVIVLLSVGGAVIGPRLFRTSAATPTEMSVAIVGASPSPTRTISPTPTLTATPIVTSTRTLQPTITLTSPPAWVGDFAEPILAAIADQKPDFQDDFSSRAGEWTTVWSWCDDGKYVDGEMVVSECSFTREMWYADFAAEMDARFVTASQQGGGQPEWMFGFRCEDSTCNNGNAYQLIFRFDGNVEAQVRQFGSDNKWTSITNTPLSQASRSGLDTNHVLVIAKGQTIALFVNGQPVFRVHNEPRWLNGIMDWGADGTVAFDNFKVWDISDIPLPPTPPPEPAPSQTPRPTATSISENDAGWVEPIVAFSEPILAAIADQIPDFQDDFSTRAGGWTKGGWCADWRLKYVEGEMVVSDCRVEREMWYTDFVAEMDMRFLPESSLDSRMAFHYRMGSGEGGGAPYVIDLEYSGAVKVGFEELGSPGKYTDFPNAARPGANVNNHLLIIVKDQAVALFVNDQPTYYGALPILWKNGGMMWSVEGVVAFDNFKIWDISNLPLAATPTPRPTATSASAAASPDTGTVKGRILWNDQPFAGVTVKLCTKWLFKCETTEYSDVSDTQGRYIITGIPPGDYNFITKTPDQEDETRWQDYAPDRPWVIKVVAGQTVTIDDVHAWKNDLQLISPAHGATASSKTPTLSWKGYPGAAEYIVVMECPAGGGGAKKFGTATTQWTVDFVLYSGQNCDWQVVAKAANGQLLAESPGYRRFIVP